MVIAATGPMQGLWANTFAKATLWNSDIRVRNLLYPANPLVTVQWVGTTQIGSLVSLTMELEIEHVEKLPRPPLKE